MSTVGYLNGKKTSIDSVKKIVDFQGMKIRIDRPKGFVMEGKDASGKPWTRTYQYDYGFLPKTQGGDGDGIDVFIGSSKEAKNAFWVSQQKDNGNFDEWKVFVGFDSKEEAKRAYFSHIPRKYYVNTTTMTTSMMRAMLGIDPNEELGKMATALTMQAFFDELNKLKVI